MKEPGEFNTLGLVQVMPAAVTNKHPINGLTQNKTLFFLLK